MQSSHIPHSAVSLQREAEWLNHCRFIRFDGLKMEMKEWEPVSPNSAQ
jgi:hypothetical protein